MRRPPPVVGLGIVIAVFACVNRELHLTSILKAPQSYLLERRIATLENALAVRGGRILSIQRPAAHEAASSEQCCVASVTYALDPSVGYSDQA